MTKAPVQLTLEDERQARDEETPEPQEYYVRMEGTWWFSCPVWATSAEKALREGMEDVVKLNGEDFLEFSRVQVCDEGDVEVLLTWTDGIVESRSEETKPGEKGVEDGESY